MRMLDTSRSADAPDGEWAPTRVPRRILLVDDDAEIGDYFAERLRIEGHQVCLARDAFEALRATEAFHAEVVFADLGLPGMSGMELVRLLRGLDWARATYYIALTGYDDDDHLEAARAAGYDAYLIKPVRFRDVRHVLSRSHPEWIDAPE